MAEETAKVDLFDAATVLVVRDVLKSIRYYCGVLGFKELFVYGEPTYYGGVQRDRVTIHFFGAEKAPRAAGQGQIYIFARDVDGIYAQIIARGATVEKPPEDYLYGMRDFTAHDLDGNRICFGAATNRREE